MNVTRLLLPLLVVLAGGAGCPGAVTYVNPADIVIPFDFGGVYLDLITEGTEIPVEGGGADVGGDSFTISYSEPASGDWDVNFFFGGGGMVHHTTFQPYRADDADNLSAVHKLGLNTVIDGGEIASIPSSPLETPDFGGSGTGIGGGLDGLAGATHMGGGAHQFAIAGEEGYIGFVLDPGTPGEQYGWIRVTLNADGDTGLIHDWAYSDSPIEIGAIPEPSSALMLVAGLAGLVLRRRR